MTHIEDNILRNGDGSIIAVTFMKHVRHSSNRGDYVNVPIDLYVGDQYEYFTVGEFRLTESKRHGPMIEAFSTCGRRFGKIYRRQRPSFPITLRLEYYGQFIAKPWRKD